MVIKLAWKDRLPKTKLGGGYLGDGFPLCSDLPPHYFLRKGSTFILTGKFCLHRATDPTICKSAMIGKARVLFSHPCLFSGKSSIEGYYSDVEWQRPKRPQFTPNKDTSALYAALCARDPKTKRCTFPREVVLPKTIKCDGKQECGAEFLKVVKMVDGDTKMYYKHSAPPCVRLAWYARVICVCVSSSCLIGDVSVVDVANNSVQES